MTEAEARHLLLVRAVEREDTESAVFTAEDRRLATAAGLAAADDHTSRRSNDFGERFLTARTEFAFARLSTRAPAIAQMDHQVRWPAWVGFALPFAALLLGFATNEISDSNRLNIIAFPLLSMIVWNLLVYLALAVMPLRRFVHSDALRETRESLSTLIDWLLRRVRPSKSDGAIVRRAMHQFVLDWGAACSPLYQARLRRTFHLSAAALAAGVLIGMYARALGVEYRAGWESTFISAETLRVFLRLVLGPASALTGFSLPDAAQLDAIRWDRPQNGEIASRWIHLFAATAAIFIILPRLLLSSWEAAHAWRLAHRMPVSANDDFYVRRLLRDAREVGWLVRVVPYSFRVSAEVEQPLKNVLKSLFGDRTQVTIDTSVALGAEDAWLNDLSLDPETDHVIVLFNLSATPEAETHGDFVARLRSRIEKQRTNAPVTVLVEESAYRQRLADQSGSAERLEARRSAWQAVMSRAGAIELSADLLSDDDSALLTKLESVMMTDPQLASGKRS